ncbi:MAG TPA: SDR family NAD(P)-dependent oxidoreductase [Thermoleophilaceae bacterium]|jgi:short-subunit dehydrogenase|nr:SDR family NAD(P)-dependent oxidoreductase [Thermoleophilaceae bacterium]
MQVGPGTRVLVTGASRGIGAAVARAFAARGCTLGVVARRAGPLEELAAGLPGNGHIALEANVADAGSIASAVERFGDVDVLVANAGLTHYMPFAELPLESAEQMSGVNWLGTLYTVKAALPRMLERRRGHVVIVSSGGGVRGFPEAAVYNGTKAAQRGFAEALRLELAGSGVSVTTVYPGEIETSLHDHEWERMPAWYHRDRRSPPGPLADQMVAAVEEDRRELFHPPLVRLLRVVNGISPGLADFMLRRILGPAAAPRRG